MGSRIAEWIANSTTVLFNKLLVFNIWIDKKIETFRRVSDTWSILLFFDEAPKAKISKKRPNFFRSYVVITYHKNQSIRKRNEWISTTAVLAKNWTPKTTIQCQKSSVFVASMALTMIMCIVYLHFSKVTWIISFYCMD